MYSVLLNIRLPIYEYSYYIFSLALHMTKYLYYAPAIRLHVKYYSQHISVMFTRNCSVEVTY